jgi:hypothetical protein
VVGVLLLLLTFLPGQPLLGIALQLVGGCGNYYLLILQETLIELFAHIGTSKQSWNEGGERFCSTADTTP